jgi:hypothetical protein
MEEEKVRREMGILEEEAEDATKKALVLTEVR